MSIENNEPAVAGTTALPGSLLRKAREEKGLTIDEMSAISNLTKQVIRGIEADDYKQLAGLSFVRGYLKLYSKKLGVDEVEILDLFDRWKAEQNGEPRQYANAPQGISEPSSGPSQKMALKCLAAHLRTAEAHHSVLLSSDQTGQGSLLHQLQAFSSKA